MIRISTHNIANRLKSCSEYSKEVQIHFEIIIRCNFWYSVDGGSLCVFVADSIANIFSS